MTPTQDARPTCKAKDRSGSFTQAASVYIPADWRAALANGTRLPEHTEGSALFADISGFTPLTEALTRSMGLRRGAEELPRHLNRVYDTLVAQVDRYRGSVVGFSGDAITCWFAQDTATGTDAASAATGTAVPATLRATACALAMQRAMGSFVKVEVPGQNPISLVIKVAIASGPARRFLVGDPSIQIIPALAGDTLARMAAAEECASRGQVVVDELTAASLAGRAEVTAVEPGEGEVCRARFFVVHALQGEVPLDPWPSIADQTVSADVVKLWVLPAVHERLQAGLGEFLTELRPAVALFLRFGGIDYDGDPGAGARLDAYIQWVQQVVARFEGILLQLTIGEKGSYLYIAFGAPIAHEDDVRRAVETALALQSPPPHLDYIGPVQMGISSGTMRTGAYGGATRRTYGVLGDQVNLAARLMLRASPGETLVNRNVQSVVADDFTWELLAPIQVKGKSEPVPIARLLGAGRAMVESTAYTGKLFGRDAELAQLSDWLQPLSDGCFAGLISIHSDPGMGKTRLVHELLSFSPPSSLPPFEGGAVGRWTAKHLDCPAEAILHQSLHPFKHWLSAYFDQDPAAGEATNRARFESILDQLLATLGALDRPEASEMARELERTRSMLGALIELHWAGSLYERLEPKLRFENTLAAIKALIQAESLQQPVVVHVEDAHWLDADSLQFLKVLGRGAANYPFVVILSGRYGDDGSRFSVPADPSVPQHVLDLGPLPPHSIRALAAQVLGADAADDLASFLADKTNGNPLFAEQLALDVRERGLVKEKDGCWTLSQTGTPEVPATVNAVLIARLDRLAAEVKAAVQTAAVLGNEFEVQVLAHMLRTDAALPERIRQAEAAKIWSAVSEVLYIFRYTLLRDAAYDMQVQSRLRALHRLAAEAIEHAYAADLAPHYADLAYHYDRAEIYPQASHHARLAGERAAARFANSEAIGHYRRALAAAAHIDAADTAEQRQSMHLALGQLLTTTGQYEEAATHLQTALTIAGQRSEADAVATACRWLARGHELRSDYPAALMWVGQGLSTLGARETVEATELRLIAGLIHTRQGEFARAREMCREARRIARRLDAPTTLARSHNLWGMIHNLRGKTRKSVKAYQKAFDLYERAGHVEGQASSHNLLAGAFFKLGLWDEATHHYQLARELFAQVGDAYHRAAADNNLGGILLNQGRLDEALASYRSALAAFEAIGGSAWVLGTLQMNLGATYIRRGDARAARRYLFVAQSYFDRVGARDFAPELNRHLAGAALISGDPATARAAAQQALDLARELKMRGEEGGSLALLGRIALQEGRLDDAQTHLAAGLIILDDVGEEYEAARCRLSLAGVYAARQAVAAARDMLGLCIPVFERLGAELDLAAARELQAATGSQPAGSA